MARRFALSESSSLQDIEDAIAHQDEWLANMAPDHPDRSYVLDQASVSWQLKYNITNTRDDIEEAICKSQAAIHEMKPGEIDKGTIYGHLSVWLHLKSLVTGNLEHINDAISNGFSALDNEVHESERWWIAQQNLSTFMLDRIDLFPDGEHIRVAMDFFRGCLKLKGLDKLGSARLFARFGALLGKQYTYGGDIKDLEEATEIGYESIRMLPDPKFAGLEYANLGNTLYTYYQRTGQLTSLEEALRICREGIELETTSDHLQKAMMFCNYGAMIEAKCQRHREIKPAEAMDALNKALDQGLAALELIKQLPGSDAKERGIMAGNRESHILNMVGAWYGTKMKMTGALSWGQMGIKHLQNAQRLRQPDHPEYPRILANITHLLEVQHQILKAGGKPDDSLRKLHEAISIGTRAAETTPETDPARGERYKNLAQMLASKYLLTEEDDYSIQSKKHFAYVARLDSASLTSRIPSAMQAGLFSLGDGEIAEAHELFQSAISLLPVFHPQSLSVEDLQQTLGQISGLSSFAASTALEANHSAFEALQSLEAGRCIISGLSMSSKSDVTPLREKNKALADEYDGIRARLSEVSEQLNTASTYQQARARQQALLHELAAKEAEVRQLEGFEFFQLPLTEDQIKDIAKGGPLIAVNVTKIRCDAIIVAKEGIQLVKLTNMTYEDLEKKIAIFQTLGNESRRNAVPRRSTRKKGLASEALIWLWDVAVRPILDVTELTPSRRVWWITSGLAGRAPFHAAGCHTNGSTENTLSRVISSYASSIKTLWYGRANSLSSGLGRNMLLVTMRNNPPPHHDLVTEHEESAVKNVFGNTMEHLSQPDPETVLMSLPGHSFVHFACHGTSIAYNPSQSGLLLVKDGKAVMLTIADLERTDLKRGAVAYLSACSTAEQPDGKLADEAIHLANAFQTLGFQHVIGTMWGANDAAAGEVAKRFYERLTSKVTGAFMDSGEVAEALHDAMIGYKEAATVEGRNVLNWGPFIHIGI
ncbi:CHAT domain-containing protein [Ilyonectria sp. MPI-CAGE-AT-0026]|nr:CHAT domain-containing protein [Ilyonectria sp. MPI-CAGE-AT-0026]